MLNSYKLDVGAESVLNEQVKEVWLEYYNVIFIISSIIIISCKKHWAGTKERLSNLNKEMMN